MTVERYLNSDQTYPTLWHFYTYFYCCFREQRDCTSQYVEKNKIFRNAQSCTQLSSILKTHFNRFPSRPIRDFKMSTFSYHCCPQWEHAKAPIGSQAGNWNGSSFSMAKMWVGRYFLSTTTSKTNSENHSSVIMRNPFSLSASPQEFSTRHFVVFRAAVVTVLSTFPSSASGLSSASLEKTKINISFENVYSLYSLDSWLSNRPLARP